MDEAENIINEPDSTALTTAPSPDETENDRHITIKTRVKLFLVTCWRGIFCVLAPLLLIPIITPFPPEKYQWCAYTLTLVAFYWVTECIPLSVASFIPIIMFPLTGVMGTNTTCKCYMNDTIIMFLGSLALAYAIEQSGLHKRLALYVIRVIGYSHFRLLFALSFTTMFVSMWITNTAATTMMVPINFALLKVLEDQNLLSVYETESNGEKIASDITTCYFCASTFSATIGGIGALVGTMTNLVFKGLYQRAYPTAEEYLSFPKFSAFTVPLMLGLQICLYFNLIFMYFGFLRPNSKAAQSAKITVEAALAAKVKVDEDWNKLGRITFWEIMTIILFVGGMLVFFSRSPQVFYGWGDWISDYFRLNDIKFVEDSAVALFIVFLMLLLPSTLDFFENFTAKENELPNKSVPSVLNWVIMNDVMPYGFMFLLGAGFALSDAAEKEHSDLNGQIGIVLRNMENLPNYAVILLIIIFTIFLTNFAANAVVANIVVPIIMQLAHEIGIHPLWYNIAGGLSASFCFCLPVGTPGNLVVQSAAKIPTIKMIKAGIGPTISTIFLTWLAVCFYAPVMWPDLNYPTRYGSAFFKL